MKLVVSDLSNIEGRLVAWLAGEEWKLEAFRAYDRGEGPDVYNLTAIGIVGGDPYNLPKPIRNAFGKVPDLFGAYQGGVGAAQTFCKAYGVRLADHWDTIQQNMAPAILEQARTNYGKWGEAQAIDLEISETEWLASESVKLKWRARHPATRQLWYACENAARDALRSPGTVFEAGLHLKVKYAKHLSGSWLLVRLPSGKFLTYFDPRLSEDGSISYMGYGQEGEATVRVWSRQYTYGGKIVENACQAIAGDVLKANMPASEAAGYEIVLTVHDEEVTQAPDTDDYSTEKLSKIMATVPEWAQGLPLAAAGFEAYRYKKED
jgi:DNA polymerase